jgi:uncharacterized protein (DUF1697 family)
MQTFISILRGINVSGQKKILMAELKVLYESLGFKEVKTYIQSGNVIFSLEDEKSSTDQELARKIEKAIAEKYNFQVPVLVRTVDEMKNTLAENPFIKENKDIETDKLHVTFLAEEPVKANLEAIKTLDYLPDRFIISGKEVFLYIPDKYGETKLSNKFFETKLKVSATTRNWNTVNKLVELAGE